MSKRKLNYDSAYAELEEIVDALQSETLGLEELNARLKRAHELLMFCKTRLKEIESDFDAFFEEEEE